MGTHSRPSPPSMLRLCGSDRGWPCLGGRTYGMSQGPLLGILKAFFSTSPCFWLPKEKVDGSLHGKIRAESVCWAGRGRGEGPISKAYLFIEHLLSIFCARGTDTEWSNISLSSLPRPTTGFSGSLSRLQTLSLCLPPFFAASTLSILH